MTDSVEVKVARLEEWKQGHEERCTERYQDIKSDTGEIKQALATMNDNLASAVKRIHERIDTSETAARGETSAVDTKVNDQKVWILAGGGALLLTILAYVLTTWGPLAAGGG